MAYSKEKRAAYDLARYHRLRAKMLEYLGNACVVCGIAENLDIHHKDPALKKFTLTNRWGRKWETICEELNKCELRCKDHHKEFHEAKHGTISGYVNKKCKCDPCRLAWNAACKKWQAKYRLRKKMGR